MSGFPTTKQSFLMNQSDAGIADARYDSKTNRRAVKANSAKSIIASNLRRYKQKKIKHAVLLKARRYIVEQHKHIDANV